MAESPPLASSVLARFSCWAVIALGCDGILHGDERLDRGDVAEADALDDRRHQGRRGGRLGYGHGPGTCWAVATRTALPRPRVPADLAAHLVGDVRTGEGRRHGRCRRVVGLRGAPEAVTAEGLRRSEPLDGEVVLDHGSQQDGEVGGPRELLRLVDVALDAEAAKGEGGEEDGEDECCCQFAPQRPLAEGPAPRDR